MKRLIGIFVIFGLLFCKQNSKSFQEETLEPLFETILIVSYPYLINTCAITPVGYYGPIAPISQGYGSRGASAVSVGVLPNPSAPRNVCVYYPTGQTTKAPVLFFMHGFSSPSAEAYFPLIDFYVSKGYVVVFPIYISDRRDPTENYKFMLDGINFAVEQYASIIDTTRVGYMGHSYGGGATPYLAHQGIIQKGWGSNGSFIFLLAPWYSFSISNTQLAQFTNSTKMIAQIYDNDDEVDNRMAIDIFTRIGTTASEKDFQVVYSDIHNGYSLNADHYTPIKNTVIGLGSLDTLDFFGIWKQLDALADYSFYNSATAKDIALGNGSNNQKMMGLYPDGQSVKVMSVSDAPTPLHPESFFIHPFSNSLNPRF
ncbi:alpha/beta hydrolase [Leptospira sp. 201903071]|uniref:alpha/beta hydrolase n=1 Tax=Leptospira ainazelensis TaxID=2810034 RepID=UPI00196589E4|nr:alpha/beta hydrolase [Leptospira ainazelensis]MBM9498834.1 alpha/beta hydrolase [Leptospira ainazelensis]